MDKSLYRQPTTFGLTRRAQTDIDTLGLDPLAVLRVAADPSLTFPHRRDGLRIHKGDGLLVTVALADRKVITVERDQ